MPHSMEGIPMETLQKELAEIKSEQKLQNSRISVLERVSDKHDTKISALDEKLNKIEENTTWIKRAIIGGIITLSVSVLGATVIAAVNGVFQNIFTK